MARLFHAGAEIQAGGTSGTFEGSSNLTVTRDTGTFRSGVASWKCDSTGANQASFQSFSGNVAFAASRSYFARGYLNFTDMPGATVQVFRCNAVTAKLTAAGKVQLFNTVAGTQIGSDSAATVVTGTWYRFEITVVLNGSSQVTDVELRLDGTTVATTSGLTLATSSSFNMGWLEVPGASKVCYVDDVCMNDNQGAANLSWPGTGKVVLLLPTADSAVGTGWTLGTGTAISSNSGSTAVKNTPPVGVADLAVGSDPKQIRNASANANTSYDATMTTYSAAGVVAADTVNAVVSLVSTGAPVTTSAKAGTVGVVSNPVIANVALGATGTAGAFWQGNTAGNYATGWKSSWGTYADAPTVTVGTAPVMRITQVTSSTRIAMVCFMGIYVDYTPATVKSPPFGQAARRQRALVIR